MSFTLWKVSNNKLPIDLLIIESVQIIKFMYSYKCNVTLRLVEVYSLINEYIHWSVYTLRYGEDWPSKFICLCKIRQLMPLIVVVSVEILHCLHPVPYFLRIAMNKI